MLSWKVSPRQSVVLFFAVLILFVGCAHGVRTEAPPCPVPGDSVADDLALIVDGGDYPHLTMWVGEIHRYCMAIVEGA